MIQEFRLPDVGEGLTEAEIVTWRVHPGDTVAVNDVIVEIETAKSLVELPSPYAGTVARLLVAAGATVPVGTPIIAVETGAAAGDSGPLAEPGSAAAGSNAGAGAEVSGRQPVLVGYGVREEGHTRRSRRGLPLAEPAVPAVRALASPPVRRLARDLGVDLAAVHSTGAGGVITRADLQAHLDAPAGRVGSLSAAGRDETRIPIKGVRKATADAMVASAFTAPHVTEWVQVDVSRSMKLIKRLRQDGDFADLRVSPLLLAAKALLLAIRRHPEINARWDGAAGEIVVRRTVNLGIAAATPRGLIVPNIKDADALDLRGLAAALGQLAETARAGRTTPADQSGGTITITNVGVFGVDSGTPILNPGEAAILCLGQVRQLPWVHRGRVVPRWVTTLALSFDHRLVDGDLGSRVLADVAGLLHDPSTALRWS